MKKGIFKISFCYLGILFLSCNLEVNTVDPQSSIDIRSSKADSFFILQYQIPLNLDSLFKIDEIWIEKSWKYAIEKNEKVKVLTGGLQLNIKISKFYSVNFQSNNYLLDWQMILKNNGYLGTSNGVFTAFIKQKEIPDSIEIDVNKLKNNLPIPYIQFRCTK
jgi:hypothetical protein